MPNECLIAAILSHPHHAAALTRYARANPGAFADPPPPLAKGFDEKDHPRGSDGHFIGKDAIAYAAGDAGKEAALRAKTKDPAELKKLNAALTAAAPGGKPAPAKPAAKPAAPKPAAAPKPTPAQKKQASAGHAGRTAAAFADPAGLTPEALGTLADDLGKMTVAQLNNSARWPTSRGAG